MGEECVCEEECEEGEGVGKVIRSGGDRIVRRMVEDMGFFVGGCVIGATS